MSLMTPSVMATSATRAGAPGPVDERFRPGSRCLRSWRPPSRRRRRQRHRPEHARTRHPPPAATTRRQRTNLMVRWRPYERRIATNLMVDRWRRS